DHPGVRIKRQLDEVIMADWMDNALIEFDDVDIPRESLLGPLNGGYQVLMDELDTERVTYCMASLGGARRALEIAAEYSTKRVQFKQPIAMFEGVSFKLAEMYTYLDAARQLVYRTAKMIEAGAPAQRESAVTKLFTAVAVWKTVDHAMQGMGVQHETQTVGPGVAGAQQPDVVSRSLLLYRAVLDRFLQSVSAWAGCPTSEISLDVCCGLCEMWMTPTAIFGVNFYFFPVLGM